MSNAHEPSTPHHVGQLTKAEILIADRLEAWGLSEPNDRAQWLLQQLQDAGWKTPPDPAANIPPLAGPGAPDDGPGRREFAEARAALAARRTTPKP